MSGDFDFEPIRGLPERLPPGESIIWQGAPEWKSLARRSLHVTAITVYFVVLLTWATVAALYDGFGTGGVAASTLWLALLGGFAVGLLGFYAWLAARTSVYTITNRRLVMRIGVALPITINLPFKIVHSAALKTYADGTGDIPLVITGEHRLSYFIMWPHIRPWRISNPQPMLRTVPNAADVAAKLSAALAAAAGQAPQAAPASTKPEEWPDLTGEPALPAAS